MVFTHLKICGITNFEDAEQIAGIGVSFLGFNFYPESKRFIEPEQAAEIISRVHFPVRSVGILVKPTLTECLDLIRQTGVDMLQIYDPLDFDDFGDIPVPVIAARRLKTDEDFFYENKGERFVLLDAFSDSEYGGTGKTLDWRTLSSLIPKERLFLAGGITPDNIFEALKITQPAVIDVASGAEVFPGKKDLRKVLSLQRAILALNYQRLNSELISIE
ncbi:MAG: phosphoribosylanthranilate isomerase [Calditrichaeota bacterium]|nr:phosphoribosylanthranilate isomerase [Calditrichota bacterium]